MGVEACRGEGDGALPIVIRNKIYRLHLGVALVTRVARLA